MKTWMCIGWVVIANLLLVGCSKEAAVEGHLSKADTYYQKAQMEEALITYINVLKLSPTNATAIKRIGAIHFKASDPLQALPYLVAARKLEPEDLEVRMNLVLALMPARNFELAGQELEYVIEKDPSQKRALTVMAQLGVQTNGLDQVAARLDGLREKMSGLAEFHFAEATLAFGRGNTNAAVEAAEKGLKIEPEAVYGNLLLGNLAWERLDKAAATKYYEVAASLDDWRSPAKLRWADVKMMTGDVVGAKAYLEKIVENARDYLPAWMALAHLAMDEREYETCYDYLEEVRKRSPSHLEANLLRCRVYLATERVDEAVELLVTLKGMYPQSAKVHYTSSTVELVRGDEVAARLDLEKAVQINPLLTDAVLLRAEIAMAKGEYERVAQDLIPFVARKPDLLRGYLLLANAHYGNGRRADALRVAQLASSRFPEDSQARLLLGYLQGNAKQPGEARKSFEAAFEQDPGFLIALEALVDLDIAEKKPEAAHSRLDKLILKDPDSGLYPALKAKVYKAGGDVSNAVTYLRKAVELNPDFREAHLSLAGSLTTSGRTAEALASLAPYHQRNPGQLGVMQQLAVLHEGVKEFEKAKALYEEVLAINENSRISLNNLAYLYAYQFNEIDSAFELAQRLDNLYPNDPVVADTVGWILYKRGNYANALLKLQTSLARFPEEPEVLYHVGMTHYQMGSISEAKGFLTKASASQKPFKGREDLVARLAVLNLAVDGSNAQASVKTLETALETAPNDLVALTKLGDAYSLLGETAKAIAAYEKVYARNSRNGEVNLKLAQLYVKTPATRGKALTIAREARDLLLNNASATRSLGKVAYEGGDHSWANTLLGESAQALPNDAGVNYDLAWAQYSVGRAVEAIASMKKALSGTLADGLKKEGERFLAIASAAMDPTKLATLDSEIDAALKNNPRHLPALFAEARLAETQKTADEAKAAYLSLLSDQMFPLFALGHKHLAILLSDKPGDLDVAYDAAIKANKAYPDDPEVSKALGIAFFQRKNYGSAARLLGQSASKLTKDGTVMYYLGQSQFNLDDKGKAAASLKAALALEPNGAFAAEAQKILSQIQQ